MYVAVIHSSDKRVVNPSVDLYQTDELNKHEQFSTLFCSDEKSSEQSKAENI